MPIVHYRRPAFENPLSNIFGPGPTTTATTPTPSESASTAATTPILSDPLGGLTSAIASILSPSSPTTSSLVPTTSSTTSTTPTTSSTPTPTPTSLPPTTVDVTSTITPTASQASATTSPSPSTSATDTSSHSTVAAAIVGSLVGVFALALMIAFFLRRWNRSRSRVRPRESINFSPDEFRRSAAMLKDDHSARFTEQKEYPTSAYQVPAMAGPTPYTPEYSYQQSQQMYASAPYPQQQPGPQQQVYSPNPHRAYPTAAQQVAFEYRSGPQPAASDNNMPVEHLEAMPNPHPVTHPEDEAAYGGL